MLYVKLVSNSDNISGGLPDPTDEGTANARPRLFPLASSLLSDGNYAGSYAPAQMPLTIELDGREITVLVTPENLPWVKHSLKDLVRKGKRRASSAANAANTAQQVGIGIGGPLGIAGLVALVTVAPTYLLGAAILACVGLFVAVLGLGSAHWINQKKYGYDELVERYLDALEDLE